MATRYYGADLGDQFPADVTEAGSTTSKDIELAVVYTASEMDKTKVLLALTAIMNYIIQDTFPPA